MGSRGADATIASVLAAVGLAMAVHAVSYRVFAPGGGIGPGFMPFVAGLALAAFSAWAGTQTLVRARRERRGTSTGADAAPRPHLLGSAERRVGLVFALAVGASLLAYLAGFLVAFGILVFVLLAVVERERLWLAATITVVAVGFCYLVFVRMLQVPLPGGLLGLLGTA